MQYEWDDRKAASNLRDHGVDFRDAIAALEDPNRLEDIDARFVYGEERVQVIGMAEGRILFVVMAMRDEEVCRIISVRKADRHEQGRYYAGDRESW
ncbi:MAG: BrnT family toxin [Terriglobia bacterium]